MSRGSDMAGVPRSHATGRVLPGGTSYRPITHARKPDGRPYYRTNTPKHTRPITRMKHNPHYGTLLSHAGVGQNGFPCAIVRRCRTTTGCLPRRRGGLIGRSQRGHGKVRLIVTIVTIRTFGIGVTTLLDAPTGEFRPASAITNVIVNDSSQ